MRYNWIPIVQSKSGSAAHAAGESQSKSAGAGRDGPNIRYCVPTEIPENPQSNADPAEPPPAGKTPNPTPTRPDRRRPGKSPIQRRPAGPPRRRPGKSPIRRRPAGPPPAGKIPKPNRLVSAVCLLLSSPHGKAGSAGKHKTQSKKVANKYSGSWAYAQRQRTQIVNMWI